MRPVFALLCLTLVLAYTAAWAADEEPENIIKNPDFEMNYDNWQFWTEGGAVAERLIESKKVEPVVGDNVAYVRIDKAGTGGNHIQFYQGPLVLNKDTTYTLSVWAKSDDKPQPVELKVIKHQNPWTNYKTQAVTFTPEWKEFNVTFKQPEDDPIGRVDIFLGRADGDVWIDHVRLYEGDYFNDEVREMPDEAVEPAAKLATTWANIK